MVNPGGLEGPEADEPDFHSEELEGQDVNEDGTRGEMELFIVPPDPPRTRRKRARSRGKAPAAGSGPAAGTGSAARSGAAAASTGPATSSTTSKLKSKVWQDFTKISKDGASVIVAECNHCKAHLSGGSKNGLHAGVTGRRSPCLHPQIQASEEGAGVTRRRNRGTSPVALESLPFNDDMLQEILIRLPPRPSSLPRASAVCKRWLGLVTDPKFICRFRAHHRKPPLLGFFVQSNWGTKFNPILEPPDRIPPQRFDLGCNLHDMLDCRHGLVLCKGNYQNEVVVCDPITGELRHVTLPSELMRSGYLQGAVLCAAGDHGHEHVHGGCHLSSYKVVLVSMARSDNQCLACVYSLETGEWGDLISMTAPFWADLVPAALVGNCLYWTMADRILEFDLDRHNLAEIMGPPVTNDILDGNHQIIQATDGAVGYAILSYPCFQMWQRNINGHGVATWVLWKTIEMHTIFQLSSPNEGKFVRLLWYDEDVVFLHYVRGVYIVQLKSMESRKLNDRFIGNRCFPFKSFFTPGTSIAGGFNGAEMLHIG